MDQVSVVDYRNLKSFFDFIWQLEDSYLEETLFPDVFKLSVPEENFQYITFPTCVEFVDSDPNFDSVLSYFEALDTQKDVLFLSDIASMHKILLKRVNLECMLLGMRGISLLAEMDSSWVDVPSVTILGPAGTTHFSKVFSRKKEAWFQDYFVGTYLHDPAIKLDLKEISFRKEGRAAPDITSDEPIKLVKLLEKINQELKRRNKPPLGFLSPFFYLCAHMFSREDIANQSIFPDSLTFWKAHCGLGRIIPERLFYEVERLD